MSLDKSGLTLPGRSKPTLAAIMGRGSSEDEINLVTPRRHYSLTCADPVQAADFLGKIDGTRTVDELLETSELAPAVLREVAANGLLAFPIEPGGATGIDFLLDLEDVTTDLLYKKLYQNRFWQAMTGDVRQIPLNVFYGLVIENYHFLYRESWFDAPALSFQGSTQARLLMNEFYSEEYGHDELLLKSLNSIEISREDLFETVPLPSTLALCNALAYWARYEPIFFFSTLGVLEGKDLKIDSFVDACEKYGLPTEFVSPVRAHAEINLHGNHGGLGRAIFEHVPYVSSRDICRFESLTMLFVELYDAFYGGVWDYYSTATNLLRRLSNFE